MDSSVVHEVSVTFDEAEYDAMIDTYAATGVKEWIEATVTIDGATFEQAGVRLKGNSSLAGLGGGGFGGGNRGGGGPGGSASADEPETLPWLIRLDKYIVGQNHEGLADLVIRSNTSETSLNEAVALDLLELAGLASQDAIATSFSINGSEPALRLAIEHPDDVWLDDNLDTGALYKAESTGDYSYRGDDPDAYDEVFDQEAGKDTVDLTPLIEFLDFINNADDETFNGDLAEHLDVEAFAAYLAMQDLIDNFDDIDGPGNNSYLYYNAETGVFTVVAWDHNLAFGGLAGGGQFEGRGGEGFALPEGGLPEGFELPDDDLARGGLPGGGFGPGAGGGPGGGSNILVERFLANPEFAALYEQQTEVLTASLYESGAAADILAAWVSVLETTDLVDQRTITEEAEQIAEYFASSR